MRGCQWSTILLSWEMLPDRGVVPVYLNQSVCQVVGYEKWQRTGHTDVILSFYIILHPILCCVYEQCSVWCRNCMFLIDFQCLILCLTLELENHLNAMSPRSWASPGFGVEAVEISSVSLQQENLNFGVCDTMSQLIRLCLNGILRHLDTFGRLEPSAQLKP